MSSTGIMPANQPLRQFLLNQKKVEKQWSPWTKNLLKNTPYHQAMVDYLCVGTIKAADH